MTCHPAGPGELQTVKLSAIWTIQYGPRKLTLNGRKVPQKNINPATHMRKKAGSLKGRMNSITSTLFGFGDNLDFTVTLAMRSIPRIMNAAALIVHGNPISGISFDTMMGKITPPRDDPEAIIPKAVARLLKNQVLVEPMPA